MRLGGPVFYTGTDPEEYALAHVEKGYKSGLCPDYLSLDRPEEITALRDSFKRHDLVLAEVGAWCNPLSPDKEEARRNTEYMITRLRLAEELEAKTCVNILGTKCTDNWFGPSKECYEPHFFEEAVKTMQYIIDTVKPVHTTLSFEMMPYCFLDSPEEYLRFLKAVDRKEAGIHLDLCNCINHPRLYYKNAEFIRHTFSLFGNDIVSIHLKDIRMNRSITTVAFDEVLIGTGELAFDLLMQEIAKLPADTPGILEHLTTQEEYDKAAEAVRSYGKMCGMKL